MRDRDLELIAALVEGRLDDESEARALIEGSAQARAEFESQRRAHDALVGLGSASMSEVERASLHRDVWSALRTEPAKKTGSAPWYARWAPALAGATALVLVGVMATVGGGEQAGDLAEIAADLDRSTPTAAPSGGAEEGGAGGDMAPLGATTSTAGATASDGGEISPEAAQFYSEEANRIRVLEDHGTTTDDESAVQTDLESCLEEAGLTDHVVADTVDLPADLEGTEPATVIAAVPADVDFEDATISFVDRATCEVVHVDN